MRIQCAAINLTLCKLENSLKTQSLIKPKVKYLQSTTRIVNRAGRPEEEGKSINFHNFFGFTVERGQPTERIKSRNCFCLHRAFQ